MTTIRSVSRRKHVNATLVCGSAVDFLRSGMDPGATDAAGDSAVLAASRQPESFDQEPFWDEFFDHYCISKPLEAQSLVNQRGSGGDSCLHAAAAGQRGSLVRKLLYWGADLAMLNDRGERPAVQSHWIQDLDANPLLQAGASNPGKCHTTERRRCSQHVQPACGRM
ncbi:hypothetical protein BESB_023260 [Besnoitia besnoiti]|uniref:Uncharacterized protein n=1 Tax=Besnoitia besnoiti TaxID=94643 RepID=A0A2A9M3P1_BESBE|nr:hypothetical protein BESB_023260 [Besnoitia besnoiti]PFH31834.1 hypothetical protein BESB_023260 [Besnoitia besnoiti]